MKLLKAGFTSLILLSNCIVNCANAGIIYSFSGGGANSGQSATYGFEFTAQENITIDSLGFFDFGMDGLVSSHRVGIWSTSRVLLTSTTVTTVNSTLQGDVIGGGQFRFTDIADFNILSGQTYVFGAAIEGALDIWYAAGINISLEPTLVSINEFGKFNGGGLVFPEYETGNRYHAGSFTAHVTDVPEPSTLVVFALGLIGLASRSLKK